MPVYTYRREDGTTFDLRQAFSDAPLSTDPATGQKVVRVVQGAGVIFKGSGFYTTDSKGKKTSPAPAKEAGTPAADASAPAAPAKEAAAPATPSAPAAD
jgi:predicted nucleic acid-binding Zn ribbon protein